jgi:hypothetical protein
MDQSLPDRPGRAENAYTSFCFNRHIPTTFKKIRRDIRSGRNCLPFL